MIVTKQLLKWLLMPAFLSLLESTTSCLAQLTASTKRATVRPYLYNFIQIFFFLHSHALNFQKKKKTIHLHYNTIRCIKLLQKAWVGPSFAQHPSRVPAYAAIVMMMMMQRLLRLMFSYTFQLKFCMCVPSRCRLARGCNVDAKTINTEKNSLVIAAATAWIAYRPLSELAQH